MPSSTCAKRSKKFAAIFLVIPDSRRDPTCASFPPSCSFGHVAEPGSAPAVFLKTHVGLATAEADGGPGAAFQAVRVRRVRIGDPYIHREPRADRADIGLHGSAVLIFGNPFEGLAAGHAGAQHIGIDQAPPTRLRAGAPGFVLP